LGKHYHPTGNSSTTDSGNGEKLRETPDIRFATDDLLFFEELDVDVVEVTASLDLVVTEASQRSKCLRVSVFLHEPSRRFRAKPDEDAQGQSGNEGGTKLKSPCDSTDIDDSDVSAEAKEDTESRPQLPAHNESAPDLSGTVFGCEDRHSRTLGSHSNAQNEPYNEKFIPVVSESGGDRSDEEDDRGDKNGTTSTEPVVERVREPATNESAGNVRSRVDETDKPLISGGCFRRDAGTALGNTELLGETQVGTVGTGLIPTLRSGTDGAYENCDVEEKRMRPLVSVLVGDGALFVLRKLLDLLEVSRSLSEEGAALERLDIVHETFLLCEGLDIAEQLSFGDASEGVSDLGHIHVDLGDVAEGGAIVGTGIVGRKATSGLLVGRGDLLFKGRHDEEERKGR